MGKVLAVVVALSVAAPAFARVKSAEDQRQDFLRASGICQASVNDQRGRGAGCPAAGTSRSRQTRTGP